MIRKSLFFCVFILFLTYSCNDNRWTEFDDVNIKNLNIEFIDFDQALFKYSQSNLQNFINNNYSKNEILDYLFYQCLNLGNPNDSLFYKSVDLFRKDSYIVDLENQIDRSLRSKLASIQVNLNLRFSKLAFLLKNEPTPKKVFWLNTLFSSSVFCTQNEIGVGLERYLGSNKKVIQRLPSEQFYQWMKDGMNEDFLIRDILVNWIYTHHILNSNGTLIEEMIQWGKVYYILYAIYPDLSENLILRYQNDRFEWCNQNEEKIWKYIVSQSLVFSKNERDINNFINEGPFTPGLPEKGPDRLGQYIGWKMVFKYMENHKSKTLEDLLKTSYNTILQEYQID